MGKATRLGLGVVFAAAALMSLCFGLLPGAATLSLRNVLLAQEATGVYLGLGEDVGEFVFEDREIVLVPGQQQILNAAAVYSPPELLPPEPSIYVVVPPELGTITSNTPDMWVTFTAAQPPGKIALAEGTIAVNFNGVLSQNVADTTVAQPASDVTIVAPQDGDTVYVIPIQAGTILTPYLPIRSRTDSPLGTDRVEYRRDVTAVLATDTDTPYDAFLPVKVDPPTISFGLPLFQGDSVLIAAYLYALGNTSGLPDDIDEITVDVAALPADADDNGIPDNPFDIQSLAIGVREGQELGDPVNILVAEVPADLAAPISFLTMDQVEIEFPADFASGVNWEGLGYTVDNVVQLELVVRTSPGILGIHGLTTALDLATAFPGTAAGPVVDIHLLALMDDAAELEIDDFDLPVTLRIPVDDIDANNQIVFTETDLDAAYNTAPTTSPAVFEQLAGGVAEEEGLAVIEVNDFTAFVPRIINGAPAIGFVNPAVGSEAGGTNIGIFGDGFQAGAVVEVGGVPAPVLGVLPTVIGAETGPLPVYGDTAVDVVVTNPDGLFDVLVGGYTYLAEPPNILDIDPAEGALAGGDTVTILGEFFDDDIRVIFGPNESGSVTFQSITVHTAELTVITPPGDDIGCVPVSVVNPGSGLYNVVPDGFCYCAAPEVTGVAPSEGEENTQVTVSGNNFREPLTVTFDSAEASIVTVNTPEGWVDVLAPAGEGTVDVSVTTICGTGTLESAFTYAIPCVSVTAIDPDEGPDVGGTDVTITGSNFDQGADDLTVEIGGTEVTNLVVVSTTELTCTTPAGEAGPADVTVSSALLACSDTLVGGFTYQPTQVAITVGVIGANPGDAVALPIDIASDNDGQASTVSFDLVFDPTMLALDTSLGNNGILDGPPTDAAGKDGSINVPTPGLAKVVIAGFNTNSIGDGLLASVGFIIDPGVAVATVIPVDIQNAVAADPGGSPNITAGLDGAVVATPIVTITAIDPNTGDVAGGQTTTITGSGFLASSMYVLFDADPGTDVTVIDSNTLTVVTPMHAEGAVDVTVGIAGIPFADWNPVLPGGYTYTIVPPDVVVTSIDPAAGCANVATPVTITGAGFVAGAVVTIGGVPATDVVVVSDTVITAVAPAGTPGDALVVVTVGVLSSDDQVCFTYLEVPEITRIEPTGGQRPGGNVILFGDILSSDDVVTFDGVAAFTFIAVDGDLGAVGAIVPAALPFGFVDVVATDGTTGCSSAPFTFELVPITPPDIESITPAEGCMTGGTAVTITGTGFKAGATVTFSKDAFSADATDVVVNTTEITCLTPAKTEGCCVDVTVTNSDTGADTLVEAFCYLETVTIDDVSPATGPAIGGPQITITGTNFVPGATTVMFDSVVATIVSINGTEIVVYLPKYVIPDGLSHVDVDVVVTVDDSIVEPCNVATESFRYLRNIQDLGLNPGDVAIGKVGPVDVAIVAVPGCPADDTIVTLPGVTITIPCQPGGLVALITASADLADLFPDLDAIGESAGARFVDINFVAADGTDFTGTLPGLPVTIDFDVDASGLTVEQILDLNLVAADTDYGPDNLLANAFQSVLGANALTVRDVGPVLLDAAGEVLDPEAEGFDPADIAVVRVQLSEFSILSVAVQAICEVPWGPILTLMAAILALLGARDGGGGGGGPCFIATAAYGTPLADQIDLLRAFRDDVLLSNAVGTALVNTYYTYSPAIADAISSSPVLKALVRLALTPFLLIARYYMVIMAMALASTAAFVVRLRRVK